MFCYKCGTEVSDAARFCHKCGAELAHEGTSLQTEGSSHTKIKVGNNDMGEELPSTTAVPNLGNESAVYFPLPDGQTVNSVEFTPNQGNETTAGVDSHIQKGPVSAIPIHQSYAASADTPKKSKKMPIVIGVGILFVLAVVLLCLFALSDNHDDMTELTQIFTSDAEGISFQYPRGWKDVANDKESIIVQLYNSEIYSFINVWKFSEMPTVADNLLEMDEGYFVENFVTEDIDRVQSSSIVDFGGIPAREVCYSAADSNVGTVYYRSYFYVVNAILYRIDLVKKEPNPIDVDRVFDAIVDSTSIRAGNVPDRDETAVLPSREDVTEDDNGGDEVIFGEALLNLILYNVLPDGDVANDLDGEISGTRDYFAICDIDQDGEKELLVKIQSGSTSAAGQFIYKVNAEHTGLEFMYSFYPDTTYYETGLVKELSSHNQGLAENFWPYSVYRRMDARYTEIGSADAWEKTYREFDFDGNPFPDEVDANGNGIIYFIGNENGIDYDNPVDDAAYREFEKGFFGVGEELYVPWRSLEIENVTAVTGVSGEGYADYSSEDTLTEYYEPLENYYRLSGFYIGSMDQSTLGLGIFSSQEEGEIAIGYAEIDVGGMYHYSGEVIPIEKGICMVLTDTGEEVLLVECASNGIIILQLLVDGQYMEEYQMIEHYVS